MSVVRVLRLRESLCRPPTRSPHRARAWGRRDNDALGYAYDRGSPPTDHGTPAARSAPSASTGLAGACCFYVTDAAMTPRRPPRPAAFSPSKAEPPSTSGIRSLACRWSRGARSTQVRLKPQYSVAKSPTGNIGGGGAGAASKECCSLPALCTAGGVLRPADWASPHARCAASATNGTSHLRRRALDEGLFRQATNAPRLRRQHAWQQLGLLGRRAGWATPSTAPTWPGNEVQISVSAAC